MEQNSMVAMDVDTATSSDKAKKIKVKMNRSQKQNEKFDFNAEIYMVLKMVHPELAISAKAIDTMNTILSNMMLKLAKNASKYNKLRKKNSKLMDVDISTAVYNLFPRKMMLQAIGLAYKSRINLYVDEICDQMVKM